MKKHKPSKMKLQSILFYYHSNEEEGKPSPTQLPSYDKAGNIRHVTVLLMTPATPELLVDANEEECQNVPEGLRVAATTVGFNGKAVYVRLVYYYMEEQSGLFNTMLAFASSLPELKSAIIMFDPSHSNIHTLQSLISKYQGVGNQQHKNSLVLLCTKSAQDPHKLSGQALRLATKHKIMYMEMLQLRSFKQVLHQICIMKCMQHRLEEEYYKAEIKKLLGAIQTLKIKLDQQQRFRKTDMWGITSIWRVKVDKIYSLIQEALKGFQNVQNYLPNQAQQIAQAKMSQQRKKKMFDILKILNFFKSKDNGGVNIEALEMLRVKLDEEISRMQKQKQGIKQHLIDQADKIGKTIEKLEELVGITKEIVEVLTDKGSEKHEEKIHNYYKTQQQKIMEANLRIKVTQQVKQIQILFGIIKENQQILGQSISCYAREQEPVTKEAPEKINNLQVDPLTILVDFYLDSKTELHCPQEKQKIIQVNEASLSHKGELTQMLIGNTNKMKSVVDQYDSRQQEQQNKSMEHIEYEHEITQNNLQVLLQNQLML